jgi:hypothetical protein
MSTAATMPRTWARSNANPYRTRATSLALRQDAVRLDAVRWWAAMHPRGLRVAGFEPEKLTRWRSTGGPVAELGAYMQAMPRECALILTQLRGYAATARELDAMSFVDAVLREQPEDGLEDVLEQRAIIEGTPKAKREFARQARKAAAMLEDAAYAAEREADAQEGGVI